ncbi:M20/M25/M40 family metallo-hydrolase [Anditalea andensis]|uniref:Acetylornithine deacetylase n=1 Tax=Anditalea andensis TaxID=1048983 RepID=A0A074L7M8_9BACT|nr:M20/M25/M40 family metallo-hydrolase [Anditalea andensis]KEO75863.1 acetylornithine deacetylase [Anditalea andensis]
MNHTDLKAVHSETLQLLQQLIEIPSISQNEEHTAKLIAAYFLKKKIPYHQKYHNIWAKNKKFDPLLPTLLLNSHHDTVKPNAGYTKNPYKAEIEDGKLYGLGSNDAGGCLVALIAAFTYYYEHDLPFNLIIAATAEEEISGKSGIAAIINDFPEIELAIVGEPTLLQLAVAEKGLMVIDARVKGISGHAAREEGENAIYKTLGDLQVLKNFSFKKTSKFLGASKASVTVINAGLQHNVVPDLCTYCIDVRVTDAYTLEEALEELRGILKAELVPRSLRLNSSKVPDDHKILLISKKMDLVQYGSPTLSDQALIPYPSVKIGPGDSARSHTSDEFIYVEEVYQGIDFYINLIQQYAEVTHSLNKEML